MTRHGPTVLVSDEFGPLISIGAEEEPMSGDRYARHFPDPTTARPTPPPPAPSAASDRIALLERNFRQLIEDADTFERTAKAMRVWDEKGPAETITRAIQKYRSVLEASR
jgi:hypothetical protein